MIISSSQNYRECIGKKTNQIIGIGVQVMSTIVKLIFFSYLCTPVLNVKKVFSIKKQTYDEGVFRYNPNSRTNFLFLSMVMFDPLFVIR